MFARHDLSMLANRFVFCHSLSPISSSTSSSSSNTNASQTTWIKTLNNIQELHTLDILRQFLENQSDLTISTRIFDIIFFDILSDSNHSLFTLYYDLILKFLSLALSFESKLILAIIARWFLTISKTMDSLITKMIEYIVHEHIGLAITKSLNNLCIISSLFTACFINRICILLENRNFILDINIFQKLIELLTYGLTNSTYPLLDTLQQEFIAESKEKVFFFSKIVNLFLVCL